MSEAIKCDGCQRLIAGDEHRATVQVGTSGGDQPGRSAWGLDFCDDCLTSGEMARVVRKQVTELREAERTR